MIIKPNHVGSFCVAIKTEVVISVKGAEWFFHSQILEKHPRPIWKILNTSLHAHTHGRDRSCGLEWTTRVILRRLREAPPRWRGGGAYLVLRCRRSANASPREPCTTRDDDEDDTTLMQRRRRGSHGGGGGIVPVPAPGLSSSPRPARSVAWSGGRSRDTQPVPRARRSRRNAGRGGQ